MLGVVDDYPVGQLVLASVMVVLVAVAVRLWWVLGVAPLFAIAGTRARAGRR